MVGAWARSASIHARYHSSASPASAITCTPAACEPDGTAGAGAARLHRGARTPRSARSAPARAAAAIAISCAALPTDLNTVQSRSPGPRGAFPFTISPSSASTASSPDQSGLQGNDEVARLLPRRLALIHHHAGAPQHIRIDLLHVGAVGPDGVHVRARRQIASVEHRAAAAGRRHDQARAIECLGRVPDRPQDRRRTRIELRRQGVRGLPTGGRPGARRSFADCDTIRTSRSRRVRASSSMCDRPCTPAPNTASVSASRGASSSVASALPAAVRTAVSDAPSSNARGRPRLRVEKQDRALHHRRAPRGVVRKDRHHLRAEGPVVAEHGRHDQHETAGALQVAADRDRGRAGGQLAERDAHGVHRVPCGERAPNVGGGKDADLHAPAVARGSKGRQRLRGNRAGRPENRFRGRPMDCGICNLPCVTGIGSAGLPATRRSRPPRGGPFRARCRAAR